MPTTKRQELPRPGLWVVSTPIGNLADLSSRARQALEEADAILCEDTRRTAKLLGAVGLPRRGLERLDAHASVAALTRAADRIAGGAALALATDAGTPGVSDPGAALVRLAHRRGLRVTVVPGPSAVAAMVSAAGFEAESWGFCGFFPRGRPAGIAEIETARSRGGAWVWFESPKRMAATAALLAEVAPTAWLVAGKELTKMHEALFAGSACDAAALILAELGREGDRGEWGFAIEFPEPLETSAVIASRVRGAGDPTSVAWELALRALVDCGVGTRDAAERVSHYFGESRRAVYSRALALGGKKREGGA